MIVNAFHHSGWLKAKTGVYLWRRACSETNFIVEKMYVALLELMSISKGKATNGLPGWLPRWANYIIPDQASLDTPNSSDVFQSTSRLVVGSVAFLIQTFLYLIFTSALSSNLWYWIGIFPDADTSVRLTCAPSREMCYFHLILLDYYDQHCLPRIEEIQKCDQVCQFLKSAAFFKNLWTSW